MKTLKILAGPRARRQAGYSTLMMMVLIGAMAILLGATLSRTYTSAKLNDRYSYFTVCNAAAEAATQKVLSRMIADIEQNGEADVIANIGLYQTNMLPSSSENSCWTNFQFLNVNGAANQITVSCIDTNPNSALVPLQSQYPGLLGFCATYAIIANVKPVNAVYNFTNAVEQTVQLAEIPVFQFAIFYNSLLEFTTAGTLTVQGRVHANSNIYVGSANPLTFNYTVTTTGVITNPAWAGSSSPYSGAVNYNGSPQFGTGAPNLVLPIGSTNNTPTNVVQILYPSTGSDTTAMKRQRYYNKAEMLILVSNITYQVTNKFTQVVLKLQTPPVNGMSCDDSSPMWFTNINSAGVTNVAWKTNNFETWLSTTYKFYDFRQQQTNLVTQINVSNFNTWCSNNSCIYTNSGTNKFSSGTPLNIIYAGDWRTTNSSTNTAIRLVGGGSANFPPYGLTVATPNPLYVWGNYDTPLAANLNSTNVVGTYPTSFISDALTILSANWQDSYSSGSSASSRGATSTTVNGAMITGVVYSTGSGGSGTTQYSGGVHNMPRMLEDWSNGSYLTLNTSMVNLFPSQVATAPFVWPAAGTVYGVPSFRQFYFNQNYTSASGLPPGTPLIFALLRADWATVAPRSIVTNFVSVDYVPR